MPTFKTFCLFIVMAAMIAGCGSGDGAGNRETVPPEPTIKEESLLDNASIISFVTLASEKTLPANFNEAAFTRKVVPYFEYMVSKADDEADYDRLWKEYGFEISQPEADLAQSRLFFVGVRESGTCPYELGDLALTEDGSGLIVPLQSEGTYCTADAKPRSFVIELDRVAVKAVTDIIIVESDTETAVPLKG